MEDEVKESEFTDELRQAWKDSYENLNVMTFSDLENVDHSPDAIADLMILHGAAQNMLYNIADFSPDKLNTARQLVAEYSEMANALIDEYSGTEEEKEKSAGVIAKVKALVSKVRGKMGKKKPCGVNVKKDSALTIFKDSNGTYRWIARYSNNYRDDDNPSEIIAKESHINFEKMVDGGEAELPELWHWHTPGTLWGKAEWVAFDEDTGIAMSAGIILEGHEKEAEALMGMDIPIGVSHGMPGNSIVRDPSDPTVIIRHITKEISDLPLWAAANKLTSFSVIKENEEMKISPQKRAYLKQFMSDAEIDELDAQNKEIANTAMEMNLESKEQAEPVETTPVVEQVKEEVPAETQVADPVVEQTPDPEQKEAPTYVTDAQFKEALQTFAEAITEGIKVLRDEVTALKEQKSQEPDMSGIPAASLAAMIAQSMTATKSGETNVRKNSTLAKSGPVETPAQEESVVNSGNPFIDGIVGSIIGKK